MPPATTRFSLLSIKTLHSMSSSLFAMIAKCSDDSDLGGITVNRAKHIPSLFGDSNIVSMSVVTSELVDFSLARLIAFKQISNYWALFPLQKGKYRAHCDFRRKVWEVCRQTARLQLYLILVLPDFQCVRAVAWLLRAVMVSCWWVAKFAKSGL